MVSKRKLWKIQALSYLKNKGIFIYQYAGMGGMERAQASHVAEANAMGRPRRPRHRTEQAMAELVDSAVSSRIQGRVENVRVVLDYAGGEISVEDDGYGMGIAELERTWAPGGAGEGAGGQGTGPRGASMALGRRVRVVTQGRGSGRRLAMECGERRRGGAGPGRHGAVAVAGSPRRGGHGTSVTISGLRVPLYPAQATKFRERFGRRYGSHIKRNDIRITVNGRLCAPTEPEVEEGSKRMLKVGLPAKNIGVHGWVALLKRRASGGDYGIHLHSRGMLISPYAKFGFEAHPGMARLVGSVTLDNVPLNASGTGFLTDSDGYREAERAFMADPAVKSMAVRSAGRARRNHEAETVLNPPDYPKRRKLARLGEAESRRLLDSMGTEAIASDWGLGVRLEDGGVGLYRVEVRDGAREIIVNKRSDVFLAFRNPLHLLVMIQAEVEAFPDDPGLGSFVSMRNGMWENRIGNLVGTRPMTGRLRNKHLLDQELHGLCDHILENHGARFQFTALSTLAEFMNNAHRKVAYTIYAERRTGGALRDVVSRHGKYSVLLDPTHSQLSTAFGMAGNTGMIVIREHAHVQDSIVAPFEKAWVDLFVETTKKGLSHFRMELEMVETLVSLDMVAKGRILAWARRRRIEGAVRDYLEVQHSDS